MNSKMSFVVGIIVGALVGGGASYGYLSKRYNKKLEENTKSLNDEYNAHLHEITEKNRIEKEKIADKYEQVTDILEYTESRMPSDVPIENYRRPVGDILPSDPKPIDDGGPIYEITESDFGEDHRKVNLNYYSSGVLTDEDDVPIDNGIDLIGRKILDSLDARIASGLEDAYVRNEDRLVDYRIELIDDSSDS